MCCLLPELQQLLLTLKQTRFQRAGSMLVSQQKRKIKNQSDFGSHWRQVTWRGSFLRHHQSCDLEQIRPSGTPFSEDESCLALYMFSSVPQTICWGQIWVPALLSSAWLILYNLTGAWNRSLQLTPGLRSKGEEASAASSSLPIRPPCFVLKIWLLCLYSWMVECVEGRLSSTQMQCF